MQSKNVQNPIFLNFDRMIDSTAKNRANKMTFDRIKICNLIVNILKFSHSTEQKSTLHNEVHFGVSKKNYKLVNEALLHFNNNHIWLPRSFERATSLQPPLHLPRSFVLPIEQHHMRSAHTRTRTHTHVHTRLLFVTPSMKKKRERVCKHHMKILGSSTLLPHTWPWRGLWCVQTMLLQSDLCPYSTHTHTHTYTHARTHVHARTIPTLARLFSTFGINKTCT